MKFKNEIKSNVFPRTLNGKLTTKVEFRFSRGGHAGMGGHWKMFSLVLVGKGDVRSCFFSIGVMIIFSSKGCLHLPIVQSF